MESNWHFNVWHWGLWGAGTPRVARLLGEFPLWIGQPEPGSRIGSILQKPFPLVDYLITAFTIGVPANTPFPYGLAVEPDH